MPDVVIDPASHPRQEVYHLLNALVVPRPIAWVSTISEAGVANLAPHSYFNILTPDPPTVYFASGGVKDSPHNVRSSRDFVVNLVPESLAEQMNLTAADFPPGEREFTAAGLTPVPSALVHAPRLAEAPAALECRHTRTLEIGTAPNYVVPGAVMRFHVAAWRDGRVDLAAIQPLGRLSGSGYRYTRKADGPAHLRRADGGVGSRELSG